MFAHEMHAMLRWLSTDPVDLRRININNAMGVCAYGYVCFCANVLMGSCLLMHIFV